jgi:hypothetical protein
MHTTTAFDRREDLSLNQLERLHTQLIIEVERYRKTIQGYAPEKMATYGQPYLSKLEGKAAEVARLIELRVAATVS